MVYRTEKWVLVALWILCVAITNEMYWETISRQNAIGIHYVICVYIYHNVCVRVRTPVVCNIDYFK